MIDRPLCFTSLRSFGDHVIEQYSLKRLDAAACNIPTTALGDHLLPLHEALQSDLPTVTIWHREGGVPSIYDMRKHGVNRALLSAIRLRKLFAETSEIQESKLVFYSDGLRERFIRGRLPCVPLASSANVYLAYEALFTASGLTFSPTPAERVPSSVTVGIFPGSRIPEKNIPGEVLVRLFRELRSLGARPVGFALEGEDPPEIVRHEFTRVTRQFSAMRNAVESVDAIISADSMPAHLANYSAVPSYVLTPKPNEYWMPLTTFRESRWRTFGDFVNDRHASAAILSSLRMSDT